MQYERLVNWAQGVLQERQLSQKTVTIWASVECSNHIALKQVKAGRKLRSKARYEGYEPLDCPVIVQINDCGSFNKKMVLTAGSGAFVFKFTADDNKTFEVIYVSSYLTDDVQDLTAIALVPQKYLDVWAAFEMICSKAVRPRIKRRRDVYIIGGTDAFFDPTVDWADVILPPDIKQQLHDDVESFFSEGVSIYKKLKLAPFRKILLAGVPGTGKTMLCAALAKHAISKRRIVVYVSGSDRDGASFEKIQRAFQAVAAARFPTLLVVEELDAYLRGDDKARILNVLDGIESPNNPQGSLMIATTNYPEAIDERLTKRPGRLDRIYVIPVIQDDTQAEAMLRHYMGEHWQDAFMDVIPDLVDQPGAFVREVALQARMLAAHNRQTEVTLELLEKSVDSLSYQMKADKDFIMQRRAIGLANSKPRIRRAGFNS
ncbi:MAG: ATP-binding protein [Phototrophicales bacterium]|nr:ATP-binding protein [Phototrophicales bacterium]